MIEHRSPISGVDGFGDHWVATAGYDNQIILWDARTKTAVARAFHDHLANQCRFSADGRHLVSASSDYSARLWSVPDLRLLAVLGGHDDDVEMALVSPSGRLIATASRDHTVRVFDLDGRPVSRLAGHRSDVISIEWSADGREILSSSDDGTIRRWDVAGGAEKEVIDLGGVETDCVIATGDGQILAGTDEGDIVRIKGCDPMKRHHGHDAGIKRLVYDGAERRLLSASYDRTIKVWRVGRDGALTLDHAAGVPAIVWLRSSAFLGASRIVFGTFGSTYASYDLATRAWDLSRINDTPGLNAVCVVDGVVFTVGDAGVVRRNGEAIAELGSSCNFLVPFGPLLLAGGQLGILFDARSGQALHQHRSPLNCGATFRDRVIVGTYTGEGLVFHLAKERDLELAGTVRLHDNAVKGVAANGTHVFSVCATGAAAFFDIEGLKPTARIPNAHDRIANGAAVLPDGRFASVSRDRTLRLWTSVGPQETVPTPHTHSIKCVAVNGTSIATGSYDGTIAVYDTRVRRFVHVERPSASGISSLATSEVRGGFFASAYDGSVCRVAAGAQDREATP